MINPTQHLLHKAVNNGPLNILCASTHERYQKNLANTGHNFYAVKLNEHCKLWDSKYGSMPSNYVELPNGKIPSYLSFDLVLIQHIFGQYQAFMPIAQQMHIPTCRIEHTTRMPWWDRKMMHNLNQMRCDINVFITDDSIQKWEWEDRGTTVVLKHGVDTELFRPHNLPRKNTILTVANDYPGRDAVLNFTQFKNVTKDLPISPVGDSPGFSKSASSVEELIKIYNTSRIFLNTAHLSPIPSSLLESASMENAIVSCNTCGISEFLTNGVDAFLVNSDEEMRDRLQLLLADEDLSTEMGKKARETIIKKCSMERFVNEWNTVFKAIRN